MRQRRDHSSSRARPCKAQGFPYERACIAGVGRRASIGAARAVRAARGASMRRSAGADCAAVLGLAAPRRNSLREQARCVQTPAASMKTMRASTRAGREPCAPRRLIGAPQAARSALAEPTGACHLSAGHHRFSAAGAAPRGRLGSRRGTQRRGRRAQRASLTDSSPLSGRNERSEWREFGDAPPARVPQGSRRSRPTPQEPPRGRACRVRASGRSKTVPRQQR